MPLRFEGAESSQGGASKNAASFESSSPWARTRGAGDTVGVFTSTLVFPVPIELLRFAESFTQRNNNQ